MSRTPRSLFQLLFLTVRTSTAWVLRRPVRRFQICRLTFVRRRLSLPEHSVVSPAAAQQLHALPAQTSQPTLHPAATTSEPAQPRSAIPIAPSALSPAPPPQAAEISTDNFRTTRVPLFQVCSSRTTSRSIATDRTPPVFVTSSFIRSTALRGPMLDQTSSPPLRPMQTITVLRLFRAQPFQSQIRS